VHSEDRNGGNGSGGICPKELGDFIVTRDSDFDTHLGQFSGGGSAGAFDGFWEKVVP
jgi:hypothetical protein